MSRGSDPDAGCSKPPQYFEAIYKEAPDPWDLEKRRYEHQKYAATLAALPRQRYSSGFEIGCSVGVLTKQLARRCDDLLAVDIVDTPLERARDRCRGIPGVRFARMRVPYEFPDRMFDLIVLSEIGYYWSRDDLERAIDLAIDRLNRRGQLLLVHWRPEIAGCPLTGDEVHEIAASRCAWTLDHLSGTVNEHYRLDLYERPSR